MALMRLHGKHHPFFQHDIAGPRKYRLLLVPPAAHAVADEHRLVFPFVLLELVLDEIEDVAGARPGLATLKRLAIDIPNDRVFAAQRIARFAEHDVARLMAGIALGV